MLASALEKGKVSCHTCGKISPLEQTRCPRCNTALHARKTESVQRCLAYLVASIIAYIPANIWPIMRVDQLGGAEETTILNGVATFWEMQAYPVAITIFVASVLIPGLKLFSLAWLCLLASRKRSLNPRQATRIYWLTELVGRWSMVDVFVVAILVALIQLGNIMSITPGPAAVSFGLMVILTMIAAHAFDPRLIWDKVRQSPTTNS